MRDLLQTSVALGIVFGMTVAAGHATTDERLRAHYPLNGDGVDATGGGADATISGAVGADDRHDVASSALLFEDPDFAEVVGSEDSFDWAATASLTLAAWVRPDAWSIGGWRAVVSTESPSWKGFGLYRLHDGSAMGLLTSNGFLTASASTPVGVWSHLAIVNDRQLGVVRFYLNGSRVATLPGAGVFDMAGNGSLKIAAQLGNALRFLGRIDDVRIYDAALSTDQVARVAALTAHYPLDGSGVDASGSGLDASLSGTTVNDDRHGTPNGVLQFSDDDFAEVPGSENAFDWAATRSLTISAWLYPDLWEVGGWRAIVSTEASEWKGFGLYRLHDGSAIGLLTSDGFVTAAAPTPVGSWSHIAVVNDREADRVVFYLNGSLVGVVVGAATLDMNTNSTIKIAAQTSNVLRFLGRLDDIRVFDAALAAHTIADIAGSVVRYELDGSGDDASGGGFNAAVNGAIGSADRNGVSNGALLFGETDEAVVVGSEDAFDWAADRSITLAGWVMPATWNEGGWRAVISTESSTWKGFGLYRLHDGSAIGLLTSLGFVTAAAETPVGRWSHVAVVNDRISDVVRFYLNGALIGTAPGAGVLDMSGNGPLKLGAQVSNSLRFVGRLDDVRLYDVALGDQEIARVASVIFRDGFENGLTDEWTLAVP